MVEAAAQPWHTVTHSPSTSTPGGFLARPAASATTRVNTYPALCPFIRRARFKDPAQGRFEQRQGRRPAAFGGNVGGSRSREKFANKTHFPLKIFLANEVQEGKREKKYFKWWRAGAGAGQGKGWREPLMPDQNIFPDETYFCQRCMFIFPPGLPFHK